MQAFGPNVQASEVVYYNLIWVSPMQRWRVFREHRTVPGGNVSGGRNKCHLTRLSKWNWIRQAKAVYTLVLSARQRAWLRFSSDPRHWWRFAAVIGTDL